MKTWLLHYWDRLTSSYWFIPSLMLAVATGLALVMLWVDHHFKAPQRSSWIYTGGPDGARALLSVVAGSVITVAGVVFSITIAALSQASSQFGPRLLRNFMRDTGNQVVLGTFVATFIFCLLILRAVRGEEGLAFVPNLSVTVAVLMSLGSLAVLIYFIHHVSSNLQGPIVVATVGRELQRAIERPFPAGIGIGTVEADVERPVDDPRPGLAAVYSPEHGYLQAIDEDGLLALATEHDVTLRLACSPGLYLVRGNPLLHIEGKPKDMDALQERLVSSFFLGRQRTAEQDLEYSVRQLVEIAVRALSPGINDPFTAINCVDWLGAAIATAASRGLPGSHRYDDDGHLRVVVHATSFEGLVDESFNQIRQYGAASVAVSIRLLDVIADVAQQARSAEQRQVLKRHASMVHLAGTTHAEEHSDQQELKARYDKAIRALEKEVEN